MSLLLRLALLAPFLTGSVYGQQLIGLEMDDGEIYSIDMHSGLATQIATTSVDKHLWLWHALAKDSTGRLFGSYDFLASGGSEIYEIDPLTGHCTLITTYPLVGVVGLAFGPGNVLYALNDPTAGTAGSRFDLQSVDLVTGTATLIGNTGFTNLGTLAYGQGTLWSYGGSGVGLLQVDPITGIGTDVNPGFQGPLDFMEGLCVSDHGVFYQVDTQLWIQDAMTGVPALAGPLNFPGILGGIESLPGPTSPFTLGTQGMTNGPMGLQVWGATPLGSVVLLRAQGGGGPSFVPGGNPCAGTQLDLNGSRRLLAIAQANAAGRVHLGPLFVPAAAAGLARLQALDLATCATSNLARVIY